MKLFTKTSRLFVLSSFILFLLAGTGIYIAIRIIIEEEVDEQLNNRCDKIAAQIKSGLKVCNLYPLLQIDTLTSIVPENKVFKDTLILQESEHEYEDYRQLTSFITNNGQSYSLKVRNSLLEWQDLIYTLIFIFIIIFLLLIIILFLANRGINRKIWKPFYHNLEELQNFSLEIPDSLQLMNSKINEFRDLNNTIDKLTGKVRKDYYNLKTFTENASHELQTPVSLIITRLESLLQTGNMNFEQSELIQSVYRSAIKLGNLNKALLLLTKIENRQFVNEEIIDLVTVIEAKLIDFEDFIKSKDILVEKVYKKQKKCVMDSSLAEVLLNNLIGNSIKHNIQKGTIHIEMDEDKLTISNTGNPPTVIPADLMNRFRKADNASESVGLGLSIAQTICNVYKFGLEYKFMNQIHIIEVTFT